MINKILKFIEDKSNLALTFIFSYLVINGLGYVNSETIKKVNILTYTLFTIISVFLGFVIVKDIILKWKKKQTKIEKQIIANINQSIQKETNEKDYNKKIEECQARIQKYNELLNLNPNDYLNSILFSFLFLLISTLSSIFLADKLLWPKLGTHGYDISFIFFWIGLYFLIRHIILFISVMSHE